MVAEQAVDGRGGVAADVAGQPVERIGVDLVQGDGAGRHGGVEAEHVVFADQVADLLGGALALGAHQHLDRIASPCQHAAAVEAPPPLADVGGGAEAEYPDVVERDAERPCGLDEGDHGRVVGPQAAVDQPRPVQRKGGEVRRRGRGGEGDVDGLLPPVPFQRRQVRGPEQVNVVGDHVVAGDRPAAWCSRRRSARRRRRRAPA